MSSTHPALLLADTLSALKLLGVTDRSVFDRILRTTLEQHTGYLGFWSVWEPNALDGRDHEFVNRSGHDDTGRYIPFWNRGSGSITLEPNQYYETPGVGEFYLRPRREGRETVIEPYEYPVAGESRFITTQVAPIIVDGRCVGAAGLDIAVEDIPSAGADNALEALLACGCVFLRAGGGAGKVAYSTPSSASRSSARCSAPSYRQSSCATSARNGSNTTSRLASGRSTAMPDCSERS
jgi:hypothetical protein